MRNAARGNASPRTARLNASQRNAREHYRALRAFVEERRSAPLNIIQLPAPPPATIGEAALQRLVIDVLRLCGWWCHHETDSRKSDPGLPDIIATRPPQLLIIELKTERGRLRPEQEWWRADLLATPGVDYLLLRPSAWLDFLRLVVPNANDPLVKAELARLQYPRSE